MEDERFDIFIKIIQKSVEKNGSDYPLTLGHLNNILNKVQDTYYSMNSDILDALENWDWK